MRSRMAHSWHGFDKYRFTRKAGHSRLMFEVQTRYIDPGVPMPFRLKSALMTQGGRDFSRNTEDAMAIFLMAKARTRTERGSVCLKALAPPPKKGAPQARQIIIMIIDRRYSILSDTRRNNMTFIAS